MSLCTVIQEGCNMHCIYNTQGMLHLDNYFCAASCGDKDHCDAVHCMYCSVVFTVLYLLYWVNLHSI